MFLSSVFESAQLVSTQLSDKLSTIITYVSLTFSYYLGIGITSLVGKFFKKNFLYGQRKRISHWHTPNRKTDLDTMF